MIINVTGNMGSGKSSIIEKTLPLLKQDEWGYHDISAIRSELNDIEDKTERDNRAYIQLKNSVLDNNKHYIIESSGLSVRMRWLYELDNVFTVIISAPVAICMIRALGREKKYDFEWAFDSSYANYIKWWAKNAWKLHPHLIINTDKSKVEDAVETFHSFIEEKLSNVNIH